MPKQLFVSVEGLGPLFCRCCLRGDHAPCCLGRGLVAEWVCGLQQGSFCGVVGIF